MYILVTPQRGYAVRGWICCLCLFPFSFSRLVSALVIYTRTRLRHEERLCPVVSGYFEAMGERMSPATPARKKTVVQSFASDFLAGGLASVLSKTAMAPIER